MSESYLVFSMAACFVRGGAGGGMVGVLRTRYAGMCFSIEKIVSASSVLLYQRIATHPWYCRRECHIFGCSIAACLAGGREDENDGHFFM